MTNPVTPELRAIDSINPLDRSFEEALDAGITTVATGPGSANVIGGYFDMKMEALSRVIRKEVMLKCHAHRADDIQTAIRIAKEFDINISLEHCTEGHLIPQYLKDEHIKAIIVGPSLSDRSKVELKNLTFETPKILNEAGIKVAIMTDHPVIPLKYITLCAALAAREGMDEEEALRSITIRAAEAIGEAHRVGSIEVGKDADIIIYNGHHFDLRNNVKFVMINGEITKNNL